jgi:hypothetical protein
MKALVCLRNDYIICSGVSPSVQHNSQQNFSSFSDFLHAGDKNKTWVAS